MCVIIQKPAGVPFDEADVRAAAKRNSDGFGYMYYDPEKKRIVTGKGLITDVEKVVELFKSLTPYEVCYHFRMKTHGKINDEQAHPFQVLDKETHGIDVYFMHNGVISKVKEEGDESDTQAFNREILQPILRSKPNLIKSDAFRRLVEEYIGTGNKLLFMYGNGKVVKFNEKQGSTFKKCWVSNEYSFRTYGTQTTQKNACSYDDNWTDEYQDYYSNGYSSRQTCLPKPNTSTAVLVNDPIKIGDEVLIWATDNKNFFAEGKIVDIVSQYSCEVKFIGESGTEKKVRFSLSDGESFGSPTTQSYWCMAKNSAFLNNSQQVEVADDKKKVEVSSSAISYKNLTVTPDYRWGGDTMEYDMDYGVSEVTVGDFHKAEPEDRLKFFVDHPEEAFNMLQDVVEYVFSDGVETEEEEEEANDAQAQAV
jgi:predicted glutamine amidotransferase